VEAIQELLQDLLAAQQQASAFLVAVQARELLLEVPLPLEATVAHLGQVQ